MNKTVYHFEKVERPENWKSVPAFHDLPEAAAANPTVGSIIRLRDGYDAKSSTYYLVQEENVWLHGGKRLGAGRKPAPYPVFTKKFRASESERVEFLSLLTGDARKDFEIVSDAVKNSRSLTMRPADVSTRRWREPLARYLAKECYGTSIS